MVGKLKKAGRIVLVVVLGFLVFTAGKFFLVWESVEVDPGLSQKPLFKTFDKQKQANLWGEDSEEDIKTNDFKTKSDTISPEYYSCYINKKPILNVIFSVGDGFSGGGYQIDILQNRYKISPYSYTDNIRPLDFLDTGESYKILESKLILDQETYKKGDRIFGYCELKVQRGYEDHLHRKKLQRARKRVRK